MDPLVQQTLEKIKNEKISPRPWWKICWPNYLFWLMFGSMVILAAFSFSMMFHLVYDIHWYLYEFIKKSRLQTLLFLLPYFWFFLLMFFLVVSYFNLRRTRRGYRYERLKMAGIVVGTTLGLGMMISLSAAGEAVENQLAQAMLRNRYLLLTKQQLWMQPELGLLAGNVAGANDRGIELVDFSGKIWAVLPSEQTIILPSVQLKKQEIIKVIGKQIDQQRFLAREIRPWNCITDCNNKTRSVNFRVMITRRVNLGE